MVYLLGEDVKTLDAGFDAIAELLEDDDAVVAAGSVEVVGEDTESIKITPNWTREGVM